MAETMAFSWWDIPGPYRFVSRVENDLRDRVNVVAALPTGLGREWFNFFRRRWSDDQERIDVLHLSAESGSPLDELCGTFTTHPVGTMTIRTLVQEKEFCGRTIGIVLDSKESVKNWMEFLLAYQRECRFIEVLDRTVLLLATEGVSPKLLPASATHLRVHIYEGFARPYDCYMYAWVLLGTEDKQAWRTDLKMAMCAQLAQWDPRVCEVLSDRDISSILEPGSYIRDLSAVLDTADELSDADEGWAIGILQRYDDQVIYHSGWLARDTLSQEFQRRVWTAQIQVIFPLIERMRQQAIKRYGHRFRLPILVGDGEYVKDPYELEISMVRRIVSRLDGIPKAVLHRLDQAWDFRNALAHLQPLTAQQLQSFEPSLDI